MSMEEPSTLSRAEAAAGWLARLRADDADEGDRRAFERWLEEDDSHREAFRRASFAWDAADQARQDERIAALRQWAMTPQRPARRPFRWGGIALGGMAAAALAALLVVPDAARVLPDPVREVASVAPERDIRRLETQVGQRASARFADGTMVTLNTDTVINVPRWEEERIVELVRGEAHFAVATDPQRPFSVIVAGKRVTALGTRFDVRLDEDESVSVTLVEGRVRVAPDEVGGPASAAPSAEMNPGTRLIVPRAGEWRLAAADTERSTSWLRGQIIFDRDSLGHAVREMNRYSEVELRLADPRLAATPVSGVFHVGRVEEFASALEAYGLVRVGRRLPDAIELRAPRG